MQASANAIVCLHVYKMCEYDTHGLNTGPPVTTFNDKFTCTQNKYSSLLMQLRKSPTLKTPYSELACVWI